MTLRFQQKLTIPVASRPLISRAELVAQLDEAISTRRLVAIAAPAGWGKTTMLVEWTAHTTLPVAWYTLDAADHDPHRFLDYLLHTVAPFVPGATELAARIDSSLPQSLAEVAHEAALLIADAPEPFAFVLDDLQLLTDGPTVPGSALVIDLLASMVEYAAHCHLVLASRTVPELRGLVRLIAQQRAAVFDYGLLQFSTAEVQQLATLTSGAKLDAEQAEQLTAQFGGWVTGIVLSLDQSIHQHYQLSFDGVTDTNQVYAYFAEQVVAPLTPDFQRFLEETSVLEDLSPERCDSLRGTTDARNYLDLTLRHSLFVSSRGNWLTYHSLFRDFLRARLARDPQRFKRLLLRAGDLYREEDDLPRSLESYLAANAEDRAIDLLREAVPRFRQRSLHTTIIACFNRLDKGLLLPADLLIEQARVYSDLALWNEAFNAIQLAEAVGNQAIRQEAQITHADLQYLRGNWDDAQELLDGVDQDALPPSLRVNYAMAASRLHLVRGEVGGAIETLEEALRLTETVAELNGPRIIGVITDGLGLAYARQGERMAAQRHLRRADACWQALGNTGRRAMTLNNLGMLALENRRYAEARDAFERGLENARHTARRRTETTLLCSLAELELIEGHTALAIERFDEAYTLAARLYIAASATLAAAGVWWAAIIAGDEVLARRWQAAAYETKSDARAEVRCRAILAHSRAYRLGIVDDAIDHAEVVAEVEPHLASLALVDQVEWRLQRAAVVFDQEQWAAAEQQWHEAETALGQLVPTIREQVISPYRFLAQALSERARPVESAKKRLPVSTTVAPDSWSITALGRFSCTHNGESKELSSLYQALLVRLLDAGPSGLAVERVWEAVWGDSELSMTALHQALRRLRTQTGLAASARDGLCLIRSPWSAIDYDVRSFEQALGGAQTAESLERIVALYRGEFLPSAPLSASLWATARRDHLQQRYLDALEQLGALREGHATQIAINYYQQILQIDGCREQTATRLMRLAAQTGNRSLVNSTYEHLTLALRTLGVTPSAATHELYRQLV